MLLKMLGFGNVSGDDTILVYKNLC
jgi:hypothetical protein